MTEISLRHRVMASLTEFFSKREEAKHQQQRPSALQHLVGGTTAGVVTTTVLYPLDLVKTRYQASEVLQHRLWRTCTNPTYFDRCVLEPCVRLLQRVLPFADVDVYENPRPTSRQQHSSSAISTTRRSVFHPRHGSIEGQPLCYTTVLGVDRLVMFLR